MKSELNKGVKTKGFGIEFAKSNLQMSCLACTDSFYMFEMLVSYIFPFGVSRTVWNALLMGKRHNQLI